MPTRKRLIIEGEIVTREEIEEFNDGERIRRSRVKLTDWQEAMRAEEGTLEFLPPIVFGHIIARQAKRDKACFVVQLPPAVRSFVYTPDSRMYTVAMPYIVLAINFKGHAIDGTSGSNKCGIFWYYRNGPIASLDDDLFYSNMPNVYGDGAVCWGKETIPLDAPLIRKVELVVAALFNSQFNQHELGEQWQPATREIQGHPQSFEEWETRSREDPTFVLKIGWRPAGVTVRQVMERWVK